MRYALIILALALSFAPTAQAAEGRRTAFAGGLVVGLVGGFLARDAMEVKPQREVVYVESQPRTVIVERPTVVYVEPSPRVIYVERREPSTVIYVEVRREVRAWQPPIAHPFPQ
jgi:hypothetical protein